MVVVSANRPESEDIGNFDRHIPAERVEFAVPACSFLRVVAGAVATLHTRVTMVPGLLAAAVLGQVPGNEVTLKDGVFRLKTSAGVADVAIEGEPRTINAAAGRFWLVVGSRVFTFDENGVGIRQGANKSYSRLPAVATTPKLFSQAERDEINRSVGEGKKSLDVAALSGYELVNDRLFLWLRWETSEGIPWLEALVRYDLSAKTPVAELVGRMNGLSTAKGRADDRLGMANGQLAAITQKPTGAGLATFDPGQNKADWKAFSTRVLDAKVIPNSPYAFTVSKNRAGAWQIGLLHTTTLAYRRSLEFRGQIVGVESPSLIRVSTAGSHRVVNLATGAELPLPRAAAVRSTPVGTLVFSPAEKPAVAQLLQTENFSVLGGWSTQATKTGSP